MRDQVVPCRIVKDFRERGVVPSETVLKRLLQAYARAGCQLESEFVEMKEQFADDTEAWLNLKRQLAAFGNSGGGIIIFGLAADCHRVGLASTLVTKFDPINIMQKLQQHAPSAIIPTAYLELSQYNKTYGFLLIGQSRNIIVFDKIGNLQPAQGRQKTIFYPGVVYVRIPGASREAHQSDVDQLVNDRMSQGVSAFLARIERVAELPVGTELLARAPGSSRGYVLVSSGQGVPVTISDEKSGVVQLTDVMTPEAPLSNLNAEVVGQLRQWHVDSVHRVPRATLMRWYLGRASFTPMTDRAEFCFLSALHDWGYPMYWASQVERERLEQLVRQQFEDREYPDNRALVYVIGAFFFLRRAELLTEFKDYLPTEQRTVVKRLLDCSDVRSYLTCGRLPGTVGWYVGDDYFDLSKLMTERETTGQALFGRMMLYHPEGNVPSGMRQLAHQLDMLVHGDLNS